MGRAEASVLEQAAARGPTHLHRMWVVETSILFALSYFLFVLAQLNLCCCHLFSNGAFAPINMIHSWFRRKTALFALFTHAQTRIPFSLAAFRPRPDVKGSSLLSFLLPDLVGEK